MDVLLFFREGAEILPYNFIDAKRASLMGSP